MIPNNRAFNGNDFFEHDGKKFFRWHYLHHAKDCIIKLKIISTNSPNKQGITLNFSDFQGTILFNGASLAIPKTKFGHYLFKEGDTTNNEFVFFVHVTQGHLFLGNASERKETGTFTSGAFGNAFWIELLSPSHFRFHCNDHEFDDDFDDLIFDLLIEDNSSD